MFDPHLLTRPSDILRRPAVMTPGWWGERPLKLIKDPAAIQPWTPNPCRGCRGSGCAMCQQTGLGPQGAFMASNTDILGYGGAAGGGKTSSAAVKPALYWADKPGFYGLLFRRTRPEAVDSLWQEALAHYQDIRPGARLVEGNRLTTYFPAGGKIRIAFLAGHKDRLLYQGGGYQYVAFDEATHFAEDDVRYLFTRQRSVEGIKSQLVLTFNPPSRESRKLVNDPWLKRWFAPWLDKKFMPRAEPREVRWFVDDHEGTGRPCFRWKEPDGSLVTASTPGARSIVFIPALLEDNQALVINDPAYEMRLRATDWVTYQQLRFGNMDIEPEGGNLLHCFNRSIPVDFCALFPGCAALPSVVQAAISAGWKFSTGWDHGSVAGHEVCVLVAWHPRLKRAYILDCYVNEKRKVPADDARAVRSMLDKWGVPTSLVECSRGDVNDAGKSDVEGKSINDWIRDAKETDGTPILGFSIQVPWKPPGSIDVGLGLMNTCLNNGGLLIDPGQPGMTRFVSAVLSWAGADDQYKHYVDAARYVLYDILRDFVSVSDGNRIAIPTVRRR